MKERSDMLHNVERRASEASAGTIPAGPAELAEPFGRVRANPDTIGSPRRDDGLTRRERRVKDLLLRELKKYSDSRLLSYKEVQNLEKELNVEWIDEQLAKMQKHLKQGPVAFGLGSLFYLILGVMNFLDFQGGGSGAIISMFWIAAAIAAGIIGPIAVRRSLRRKIFIYEALRELAGADEAGVTLDRAVRDADQLISRIVDMELAAEDRMPAKSIGRQRVQ
ncbi:MAG: hypothetical protein JJ976_05570 [Rhodothermales bacterium]|nr:hypothetical protein [Rhodothermales bacterium]